MFKTGTTTMGALFEEFGLKTFHGPFYEIGNSPLDFDLQLFKEDPEPIVRLVDSYDAFEDYPFMFIYPWLADRYPDAKFILTERSADDVAKSDINWWKKNGVPADQIPEARVFIERYRRHHADVLDFFRSSDRLLRVSVGDPESLRSIHRFIGIDGTMIQTWPRKNKGSCGIRGLLERFYWRQYWKLLKVRDNLRGKMRSDT
jgi:hypothetical protein